MYTKLFGTIIHSTVWREEMHVKVVWITMLAMADREGYVLASLPGLADVARVSLDQCQDALARLAAPDPHSRTPDHEGRRIMEIGGGWRLLNYAKYRDIRDAEHRREQVREAVRRHREKRRNADVVIESNPPKAYTEAEAESDSKAEVKDSKPKALVELRSTAVSDTTDVEERKAQRRATLERLKRSAEVVFSYWRASMGKSNRTVLDAKRERRLIDRLRENGGDVSELLYAVDGALKDDFIMGRDDHAARAYNGIETIFRDRGQVERLVESVPTRAAVHPSIASAAGVER